VFDSFEDCQWRILGRLTISRIARHRSSHIPPVHWLGTGLLETGLDGLEAVTESSSDAPGTTLLLVHYRDTDRDPSGIARGCTDRSRASMAAA
jgi:hypothetical protein